MSKIILASTSPYRAELLKRLSWPFQALRPPFDEETMKSKAPSDPQKYAEFLAQGKAASLAPTHPDHIVIGGDQLASFEGKILGKPHTEENAVSQLLSMSGKTHELITSVCLIHGSKSKTWSHISRFEMRRLSKAQIQNYVRMDQPLDCAGAYKFELHGILLFEKIECDDFSAIQGLPLLQLAKNLVEFGLTPFH